MELLHCCTEYIWRGLWQEYHTSGAQQPVPLSPPSAPPDNPGTSLGLPGQHILSFLALPGRVGQSRHHELPSGWLAGRRLQLASEPYFWLGCYHNTYPWSRQEGEIPPITLGACYPSPNKLGPTDQSYWDQHQSLPMTSFPSRKGSCMA